MEYVETLLRLIASLNEEDVEYVLIGGAALNVHGLLRATEDIDFFVEPDRENIERLKRALRAVWDDEAIDEISAEELCGDYPALRYGPPMGTVFLDVMTRLGERTLWDDLQWEEVELRGVSVRVATPRTLFDMKKNTVRPRDRADAGTRQRIRRGRRLMPIQKYRSVEDMPDLSVATDPEERLARIAALWEAAHFVEVLDTPRGVQKFRSIEEASAARQDALADRMRERRQTRSSNESTK